MQGHSSWALFIDTFALWSSSGKPLLANSRVQKCHINIVSIRNEAVPGRAQILFFEFLSKSAHAERKRGEEEEEGPKGQRWQAISVFSGKPRCMPWHTTRKRLGRTRGGKNISLEENKKPARGCDYCDHDEALQIAVFFPITYARVSFICPSFCSRMTSQGACRHPRRLSKMDAIIERALFGRRRRRDK